MLILMFVRDNPFLALAGVLVYVSAIWAAVVLSLRLRRRRALARAFPIEETHRGVDNVSQSQSTAD